MAVNVWEPSLSAVEPSVVTTTVELEASFTVPITLPSARTSTLLPGVTPVTWNCKAFPLVELFRLVDWLLSPVPGKKVRLLGAAGITAAYGFVLPDVSGSIVTSNGWGVGVLVPSLAITVTWTVTALVMPAGA